jgi:hypothetical protein
MTLTDPRALRPSDRQRPVMIVRSIPTPPLASADSPTSESNPPPIVYASPPSRTSSLAPLAHALSPSSYRARNVLAAARRRLHAIVSPSRYGVGSLRTHGEGVASGASRCMSRKETAPIPSVLLVAGRSPSFFAFTPPVAQSAACRKRQRSLAPLRGVRA